MKIDGGSGVVLHIFLANKKSGMTRAVNAVEALTEQGLRGDRYEHASNRSGPDCQLSLIEIENIEEVERKTGLEIPPYLPRRNIVTRGIRLNDLVGRRFTVGAALCEGIELCEPCVVIAKVIGPKAVRPFVRKAGLRARIASGGLISVGDRIETLKAPAMAAIAPQD